MQLLQRDLYQQLRTEAIDSRERIAELVKPLDGAKINEHPEPEGWSVAQVLEHLCVADESYEMSLEALLRSAREDGGLIAGGLLKPKPLKAPKVFEPGPTPRMGVLEALLAREMKFVKAMDDASSFDWRALRIKSPALPSWAPSMNLGDGFRIHIVHLTRHSHQIERLVGKLG